MFVWLFGFAEIEILHYRLQDEVYLMSLRHVML